jgi:membrane-bound serine protease (ClpP class)
MTLSYNRAVRPPRAPGLVLVASVALASPGPRAAATTVRPPPPQVDIVKVQGVIDPAVSDYVRGSVEAAEAVGSTVLLQLDSQGAYGQNGVRLAAFLSRASVPVIVWAGPSGARVADGAMPLLFSASLSAMAPGAGIGPALPFGLGLNQVQTAALRKLAGGGGVEGARLLIGPPLPAGPALESGAVDLVSPSIPDLLRMLDGRSVETSRGPVALVTLNRRGRPVRVSFHELGPARRVIHAVSTPAAAYLLLVLGLWAIAFELTQPGLGVAGIAGIGAVALAGYGLSVIPVRWLGVGLILGGMALQGIDILIRRVAVLTIAGTASFAAGSVVAWHGVGSAIDLPLWLIVVATLGGVLFFGFALTVALRSRERIRTAQVGLVGLIGEVRSDLDPEGGVYVKGSMWRARSMDGPIPKGRRVRVRGIDGLILRVEEEPD